ncbi:prephenate dehydrogenase/arogenate dehydrogenase family protein [Gilvimarinus algae]|uniref:Prephenate dehydrogenase/arogenate dehydrogenase family protein n=1 Tax=Gilvimarinus algae TaxID=3058037 RepID=A0ABT8TEN2_9GAMM|nr:prephenate dehydrogenase/arogenate dehydrogenase family protein [Gilvimarinus sp. SDUM040014]MDO3382559.1 prephenate dehydrogenase/arogenate dehydrogenase family protein [Gilvimarinus sp. SDUM040014]
MAGKQAEAIGKLVVIGVGLIGGSVACGARQRRLCQETIGVVRDAETARLAVEAGVVDRACLNIEEVAPKLGEGDLVMVAVPTLAVEEVLRQLQVCLSSEVTVTDGASVKGSVAEAARRVYGLLPAQLVLGHPIAGSEKSGVSAANPNLYVDHRVILTPTAETGAGHLARVRQLWQGLEAEVVDMPIAEHDDVLGATSHLPHAIAYSLVDTLAHDIDNPNIFRYAAGGFRDFTRIASSDPVMWHDIMKANRHAVVHSLDQFMDNLTRLRAAIERSDGDYLLQMFTRAKTARDCYTRLSSPNDETPE